MVDEVAGTTICMPGAAVRALAAALELGGAVTMTNKTRTSQQRLLECYEELEDCVGRLGDVKPGVLGQQQLGVLLERLEKLLVKFGTVTQYVQPEGVER